MIKNLNRKKSAIVVAFACSVVATFSHADESIKLDKVEVTGILPEKLESVPGSFNVVDEKELEARRPFSIQEALNNVPGVHVVGEGAQSLNLNIGVRGLNPRRTSRTLLLEDGMPLFLAPYGDPSAHYATPLERVERIEIVKGSGQVLYGPQTVGGMINFVTKPIPKDGFAGSVSATAGNNDFRGVHFNLGYGGERGGVMVDALNRKGDGIRKDHDFEVNDVTLKGLLNLTETQSLMAKVGWYEENSHYSEAGLDTARYNADPTANPFGKNDTFEHERKSLQLVHNWAINDTAKLTTQAYYVNSERASYRQTDESLDQMTRSPDGVNNIATCPSASRRDYENFANLCGNKMRPREYAYWGVEPRLDFSHNLFGLNSDAVLGFRYHEEDINRKRYNGATPRARENDPGSALRDDSDIQVESMALYGQNTFFLDDFALTPGLRVERLKQTNKLKTVNFVASGSKDSETETTLLPGFGVAWNGIANTTVFAGIHRGFAPPRPDRDLDPTRALGASPEKSTNTEVGFRTSYFKGVTFESTLFNIDFDNLVVGPVNGQFLNAGKAQHTGLEAGGRIDFGTIYNTPHNFYLTANYTSLFTAKFKRDAATDGIESGNRLPYAPRDLASVNFGYSHPTGIDARFGIDYVSQQYADNENSRVESANGQDGIIPSYTLLNASVNFRPVGSKASYFLSGHNLADKEYLSNRVDGMFLGRGRQVFGGIRYDF